MSADAYLQQILTREAVDVGPQSPALGVQTRLDPILREWANRFYMGVTPSGSFAKGTANRNGTDIDLFISLSPDATETLKEVYESLFLKVQQQGYSPKRQNVSIKIRVGGYDVDLVPGKLQSILGEDHSLYRRRVDSWTKTNIRTHIRHVVVARRSAEIRILKLWRDQKSLDFPSFYLELVVIAALSSSSASALSGSVWNVLQYLSRSFAAARVQDPANTNNIISDDLSALERSNIVSAARAALSARNWSEIVR